MKPTENQPHNFESKNSLFSPSNTIAVYTVLRILFAMRARLGLEAMLEYTGKYLESIEHSNPKIECAVTKALCLMDVGKIYGDIVRHDKM